MSSQEQEDNKVVLQSRDLNQLMTMANLDLKLNKNAVLKINITDAIKTVRQDMRDIKIRMYGNIVFAISKGILRTLNVMSLDLRETIEIMRKNIKPTKREEEAAAGRLQKTAKKDRIAIPTINSTETKDEQASVSSVEKPLHTSSKDKITVVDRFTPFRMQNFDASRDSLHPQLDFSVQIEGFDAQPVEFQTSANRYEDKSLFDFPTTPGKALPLPDFISPGKPKQTFPSLDIYLESVRKGKDTIFEEEEEKLSEGTEDDEAQNRRRRENRARGNRRVNLNPDLETRWDYDEKPEIERIEEERPVTDAALFIQKVQAPTVPVAEQRLGVNVDHFLDAFTSNALDKFNQRVRDLQEEQVRAGTEASGRNREFLDTITRSRIQPEEPSGGFAGIAGDYNEPSGFIPHFEESGGVKERKLFEPSVLEGIGLFLDEQQLDEKESASEVFEKVTSLASRISGAKKIVKFEDLVENETRISKANTFYELMNLAKTNRVNITQAKPFDDIEISTITV